MYGTIHQHKDTRFDVFCTSRGTYTDQTTSSKRIDEVQEFWKTESNGFMNYKDLSNESEATANSILDRQLTYHKYDAVFGPSAEDSHFEHRLINGLLASITRHWPISIIEYKCSSTLPEWTPNFYVPIPCDVLDHKIEKLQTAFVSQMDSKYFQAECLKNFHLDFTYYKKAEQYCELFRIRTLYGH
jgi:hypothetical protein